MIEVAAIESAVKKVFVDIFGLCSEAAVNLDKPLSSYDGDSLDLVEILMMLEDELGIDINDDAVLALRTDLTKITGRNLVELATAAQAHGNTPE